MDVEEEEWRGQLVEQGDLKSQNERLAPYQTMNSTGGYVYSTDYETQLMRFLCIGTTGGTYYTGEAELTRENTRCIDRYVTWLFNILHSQAVLTAWGTGLAVKLPTLHCLFNRHCPLVPLVVKTTRQKLLLL